MAFLRGMHSGHQGMAFLMLHLTVNMPLSPLLQRLPASPAWLYTGSSARPGRPLHTPATSWPLQATEPPLSSALRV